MRKVNELSKTTYCKTIRIRYGNIVDEAAKGWKHMNGTRGQEIRGGREIEIRQWKLHAGEEWCKSMDRDGGSICKDNLNWEVEWEKKERMELHKSPYENVITKIEMEDRFGIVKRHRTANWVYEIIGKLLVLSNFYFFKSPKKNLPKTQ